MNKTVVPTLELRKVVKTFKQGSQKLDVLKGVDLEIMPGEIGCFAGTVGVRQINHAANCRFAGSSVERRNLS